PAFRCIQSLRRGADQVVAELVASDRNREDAGYVLPLGLLDSALQASLGLVEDPGSLSEPAIPFMLERLLIIAPCETRMYAWIRQVSEGEDGTSKLDIDLCNTHGQVCVRLIGLGLRRVRRMGAEQEDGLLLARPEWQALAATGEPAAAAPGHHVLLCGSCLPEATAVEAVMQGAEVHTLSTGEFSGRHGDRYQRTAVAVFERLQRMLQAGLAQTTLVQLVVAEAEASAVMPGLSGLIATAQHEQPQWRCQLVT